MYMSGSCHAVQCNHEKMTRQLHGIRAFPCIVEFQPVRATPCKGGSQVRPCSSVQHSWSSSPCNTVQVHGGPCTSRSFDTDAVR